MSSKKYEIGKDCISIEQFVSQYLGIDTNCSNLRHIGLRSFESPLVIGVSNEYANKNPELVKKGIILIVLDCKKDKGTYINPIKLKSLLIRDLELEELKEIQKIRIHNLEEVAKYYQEYNRALKTKEELDNFYKLIESLNKTENIDKIRRQEEMFANLYGAQTKKGR